MEQLNELKNLVMQNLEKNGYLSNIRAQIRSSVFKTIDSQQTSNKKASPFYAENLKVQKLAESKQGQQALELIQQTLSFYEMENSLTIFNSQSNSKTQSKRSELIEKHKIQEKQDQPALYTIFSNFMKNQKPIAQKPVAVAASKASQKAADMPMQMKQDESQGQVQEEIIRNQSKKFGQSEQFGQSQGYDITVDSLKLEEYDYYEEIEQ